MRGAFTEKTRDMIRMRSGHRCEICGARIPKGEGQVHHRQPRGMGGTDDPGKESVVNGLFVHPGCHRKIELNRTRALESGWLVRQSDDPGKVPVRLFDGWWLLNADGTMRKVYRPG